MVIVVDVEGIEFLQPLHDIRSVKCMNEDDEDFLYVDLINGDFALYQRDLMDLSSSCDTLVHSEVCDAYQLVFYVNAFTNINSKASTTCIHKWNLAFTIHPRQSCMAIYPLDRIVQKQTSQCTLLPHTKNTIDYAILYSHRLIGIITPNTFIVFAISRRGQCEVTRTVNLSKKPLHLYAIEGLEWMCILYEDDSFQLMDITTGRPLQCDSTLSPLSIKSLMGFPHERVFLILEDKGLVISSRGEKVDFDLWDYEQALHVQWTNEIPPSKVFLHGPFLLCIFTTRIEIRFYYSFEIVQSVLFKAIKSVFASPDKAYYWIVEQEGNKVHRMHIKSPMEYLQGMSQCDALFIHRAIQSSSDIMIPLLSTYAQDCFTHGRFDKAIRYLVVSGKYYASITPYKTLLHILALYPMDVAPRRLETSMQMELNKLRENIGLKSSELKGDDLVHALRTLQRFLKRIRKENIKATRNLSENEHCLIDTLLLKTCVLVDDDASHKTLLSLVQGDNGCEIQESEMFLGAHGDTNALLALYKSHKMHKQVLELLQERCVGISEEDVVGSNDRASMIHYLEDRMHPSRDMELILTFSKSILEETPVRGLELFYSFAMRDVSEGGGEYSLRTIVDFFKSIQVQNEEQDEEEQEEEGKEEEEAQEDDNVQCPIKDGQSLAISFLYDTILSTKHHLIIQKDICDELIYMLLDVIVTITSEIPLQANEKELQHKIHPFQKRLETILGQRTVEYHPERILSQLQPNMLHERALCLSALDRHDDALQVFVHDLQDIPKAEDYCNQFYPNVNLYCSLLGLMIAPKKDDEESPALLNEALEIMSKHFRRVDTETILKLLPEDRVLVSDLEKYFTSIIQYRMEEKRNLQVSQQLNNMEYLHLQDQLYTLQKESIRIVHQLCSVCHTPIRPELPFQWEGKTLQHYACR